MRASVEAYKECADDTNRAMASSIRDERRFSNDCYQLQNECGTYIFISPVPARTSASSAEVRKPIICEAVDELLTTCFALMSSCIDSDVEIEEMHERQRDLFATLFYRLTDSIGMCCSMLPSSINQNCTTFCHTCMTI